MSGDLHGEIRRAAQEWEALRCRIRVTLPERGRSKEGEKAWREACAAWHAHRSVLDTFWRDEALVQLEAGDPAMLDLAIAYVEVDPYYFRSGYLKKRLFRRLKRLTLPDVQKKRIQQGVLGALRTHQGSGWKDFCLLASAFSDPEFVCSVVPFVADSDSHVARRAQLLLKHVNKVENKEA